MICPVCKIDSSELDRTRLAYKLVIARWIKDMHEIIERSEAAEARLKADGFDMGENPTPCDARILITIVERLRDEIDEAMPRVSCRQCGKTVERVRECYAVPTCYTCLPPPPTAKNDRR